MPEGNSSRVIASLLLGPVLSETMLPYNVVLSLKLPYALKVLKLLRNA
jgi:hypothetical protein